ncbi:uncharacterized protein LOC124649841 [Lolium rigidum]|uniref:uncharacterized protein LOC124649841 n=1 Tax=Lolium rigidum TaxID=89674 RepID=UPI001F5CD707|nr:uncharacterized protein LOC124649841 [Lolium rigidum]
MAGHGKPSPKPPGAPAPPPPPSVAEAKKGFMRRMFPFLLAVNLFVGAYVVVRTYYKDSASSKGGALTDPASTADKPAPEPAAAVPRKKFPPIPEDEQRRVYMWMLEEKRKVRPRDKAEKRRLDDEKALLKEIIRAESLPKLL